jgi:hypothetical protein
MLLVTLNLLINVFLTSILKDIIFIIKQENKVQKTRWNIQGYICSKREGLDFLIKQSSFRDSFQGIILNCQNYLWCSFSKRNL